MKYFEIGKIVNTQGIKGEVRIISSSFDEKRFELLETVEVFIRNEIRILTIENVRYHKQFVIIKFKEVSDMTQAEKLKTGVIKVTEDKALPLGADEYYISDLYGMEVRTAEGEYLGKLKDIMFTGANDVYVVGDEGTKEILIPAIKQCIKEVNIEKREMVVTLLEGLR